MNKEVMRITVNSAYEFVYLYEKYIKTKTSFSTPLFYLQSDVDDLSIILKSDDIGFVNRCGITPKITNKQSTVYSAERPLVNASPTGGRRKLHPTRQITFYPTRLLLQPTYQSFPSSQLALQ